MSRAKSSEIKIGLEVHCQLTNLMTKLFCSCSSDYRREDPNTYICPICMGVPGTLPVLNEKALEDATMVAIALNSDISERMLFFRKNYFYPDMPKNFQISQYDKAGGVPFSLGGYVQINKKKIRIRRIQIEEDPGKLIYEGTIESSAYTLVDYNRANIALIEIVTEPDIRSPKEARKFLEKLRSILEHLGVSDGSLEGSMRCDANVSLKGGRRVEIKNISSFKEVERALNFEITRQKKFMEGGLVIGQETRHWDEVRRITISLRSKEEEEDYRYFPEPDLVPIKISKEYLEDIKLRMPELPDDRTKRFMKQYNLLLQNAEILTRNKKIADFFEECLKLYKNPRELSNWLIGELLPYLHNKNKELEEIRVTPKHIVDLLKFIDDGTINRKMAKSILQEMLSTSKMPYVIIKEKALKKILDKKYVIKNVEKVIKDNPKAVEDSLVDEKAIHYLMGQLMILTKGKIDPKIADEILRKKLQLVKNRL
ncbi:MAG: Asp-tRNA(Asn)/Glu-tRNA(Gln) amidotransferase subunit GatB [Candidatus Methylarchaceae archaeon HK02M2]|nr:Asp-tRNA(Asn)/Glu-tRNA(Gln) amidotransferase subunit GatB [Candidatus Methylarchaceae archaeon HK02M2]